MGTKMLALTNEVHPVRNIPTWAASLAFCWPVHNGVHGCTCASGGRQIRKNINMERIAECNIND